MSRILDLITLDLDEGQRQIILLALHKLRAERPGWDDALGQIETKLGGQLKWPKEPDSKKNSPLLNACERALEALLAVQAAMEYCAPEHELEPIPTLRAAIADAKAEVPK